MNYLAHALLSFKHPEILAGNMISDFVKGKKKFDYSADIQKGMTLHRLIDTFTDQHPVTREAKSVFKADYGLYSGAFMDIVYDHFLATDSLIFPKDSLEAFTLETYKTLDSQIGALPENFLRILPYMKNQNWLLNYKFIPGIRKSFEGLVYRASFLHDAQTINTLFEKNYTILQDHYKNFFPELHEYSKREFIRLSQFE